MEQEKKMKPIWYFIGLMLLVMGAVITVSGIYRYFVPGGTQTALAELHPDIWWGLVMVIAGAVFLLVNRKVTVD